MWMGSSGSFGGLKNPQILIWHYFLTYWKALLMNKSTFIGGAAFCMSGKSDAEYKGVADFLLI